MAAVQRRGWDGSAVAEYGLRARVQALLQARRVTEVAGAALVGHERNVEDGVVRPLGDGLATERTAVHDGNSIGRVHASMPVMIGLP